MTIARHILRPLLFLAVVVAVIAYFVLPTTTWIDQKAALAETRSELEAVEADNAEMAARIEALHTSSEIERIARRDFSLIYPGEEAYAILPPPLKPVTLPNAWPFNVLGDSLE